jgi:hypothetical protein
LELFWSKLINFDRFLSLSNTFMVATSHSVVKLCGRQWRVVEKINSQGEFKAKATDVGERNKKIGLYQGCFPLLLIIIECISRFLQATSHTTYPTGERVKRVENILGKMWINILTLNAIKNLKRTKKFYRWLKLSKTRIFLLLLYGFDTWSEMEKYLDINTSLNWIAVNCS